jgi:hypothetical protein
MPASEPLRMPNMAARYRLEGYSDEQGNSASALEKRRNVNVRSI